MACTTTTTSEYEFPSSISLSLRQIPPPPLFPSFYKLRSSCSISPPSPLASTPTPAPTAAADLPVDILNCIQKRLPLDDYLRFPAVCSSWRSAAKRIAHQPFSDDEFPWVFSLRCGMKFTTAVSLSPDNSFPPKTYSIPVPQRFQGHTVACADSHLLMIENTDYKSQDPDTSGIYLVNPFDSWAQHGRLPSSSTLSVDPTKHSDYQKITRIAMNNKVAVAIWGFSGTDLAYTRLGIDRCWTDLKDIGGSLKVQDVVAYKDDVFCAVDTRGAKVLAFDFSSATVRLIDMTLNLQPYKEIDGWTCFQDARLVNSSDKLFLVRWRNLVKRGERKRREADVYKLMDAEKKWVPIKRLDNLSFFLGINQSISLSTTDSPRLRSNCIYFPYDAIRRQTCDYSVTIEDDDDDFRTQLMYDLGHESWEKYHSSDKMCFSLGLMCVLSHYIYSGLWMTPRLLPNTAVDEGGSYLRVVSSDRLVSVLNDDGDVEIGG